MIFRLIHIGLWITLWTASGRTLRERVRTPLQALRSGSGRLGKVLAKQAFEKSTRTPSPRIDGEPVRARRNCAKLLRWRALATAVGTKSQVLRLPQKTQYFCRAVSALSSTSTQQATLSPCPASVRTDYPHRLWITLWMTVCETPRKARRDALTGPLASLSPACNKSILINTIDKMLLRSH